MEHLKNYTSFRVNEKKIEDKDLVKHMIKKFEHSFSQGKGLKASEDQAIKWINVVDRATDAQKYEIWKAVQKFIDFEKKQEKPKWLKNK